jgi:hypothetical protein
MDFFRNAKEKGPQTHNLAVIVETGGDLASAAQFGINKNIALKKNLIDIRGNFILNSSLSFKVTENFGWIELLSDDGGSLARFLYSVIKDQKNKLLFVTLDMKVDEQHRKIGLGTGLGVLGAKLIYPVGHQLALIEGDKQVFALASDTSVTKWSTAILKKMGGLNINTVAKEPGFGKDCVVNWKDKQTFIKKLS